ncbi:hypothetical protein N7530_012445 [Penicillium desertorum]|uniref:Uncharacterized protein n=1 Tax=Penicillium desertorum TaxID=1303715 RepID=A0A9W9WFC7_9EURO|nr:hypothetical protein N7530_012445 [Penicillium desertorum]
MSDNEQAFPGMGTPPNSPIPSSSNLAGPSGLGTPPSSPVAPVAPVALTGQQAGGSISIPHPAMQLPARPRLGPAQHPGELNTPSPLALASDLPSMPQNSASVHTQPMAANQVASDSVSESYRAGYDQRAAPVQRITQLPPMIWVPPPTSPPPGLSTQTTHDQGQQPAVRAIIPGLTHHQGCPPGTITYASTQPAYGSAPAHVTAFGAPFVTHGPPGLAYVQPPAVSSDNNHVGSLASAGMAQPNGYQFPAPPGLHLNAGSTGGFPTTGMPNAQQYPPPPGLQLNAGFTGGFPQRNGHQYPAPPGLHLNAGSTGSLPTAGTEQPATRQLPVTPPWRRENAGVFPSAGIHQPHVQQYSASRQPLNASSTGSLPSTSGPQPAPRQFPVTPPWRRRQVMPARQQINNGNLQHPRPIRPALRFAGIPTPQDSAPATLKRTYRARSNSRAAQGKDAGQESAGPSTALVRSESAVLHLVLTPLLWPERRWCLLRFLPPMQTPAAESKTRLLRKSPLPLPMLLP